MPTKKVLIDCLHCGIPTYNQKFCRQSHQLMYQRELLVVAWKTGDVSAASRKDGTLRSWARNYVLSEAEYKCSKCGWNEPHPLSGVPPLQVDHKDGDCRNSRYENLEVLCPNHHALTATFGSRNSNTNRIKQGLSPLDRKFARPERIDRYRARMGS